MIIVLGITGLQEIQSFDPRFYLLLLRVLSLFAVAVAVAAADSSSSSSSSSFRLSSVVVVSSFFLSSSSIDRHHFFFLRFYYYALHLASAPLLRGLAYLTNCSSELPLAS